MRKFLALLCGLLLLTSGVAYAQNTIPYEAGTSGLTNGNLVKSGATVGQLQDAGANFGTLTNGDVCTYTTSGTVINCNTAIDGNTITLNSGTFYGQGADYFIPNAGSTGTTVNKLAKLTGVPSTAVITATTDPPNTVAVGIVTAGAGTTGTATVQFAGLATCVFDGATVAGHGVQISSTTAGDCHDAGITPSAGQIVGTVLGTIGSAGNAPINLNIPATSTFGLASLSETGQVLTGGFHPSVYGNGTGSSGTVTIDCGNGPYQTLVNGGSFTLAMSSNDGGCTVRITNNSSAGTITPSGFSEGTNTGDYALGSLPTTNQDKFDLVLTRIGGNPHYLISALQ